MRRRDPRPRVKGYVDPYVAWCAKQVPNVELPPMTERELIDASSDSNGVALSADGLTLLVRVGYDYDYTDILRLPLVAEGFTWYLKVNGTCVVICPSIHIVGEVHCFASIPDAPEPIIQRATELASRTSTATQARGKQQHSGGHTLWGRHWSARKHGGPHTRKSTGGGTQWVEDWDRYDS